MNIEETRNYCLKKPNATEDMPFGEGVLAFRINGKIFLLTSLDQPDRFNVKCDPEKAVELRELYEEVKPGFHMNKKHWNTVHVDGRLPKKEILWMIDHSYELVAGVKKK